MPSRLDALPTTAGVWYGAASLLVGPPRLRAPTKSGFENRQTPPFTQNFLT